MRQDILGNPVVTNNPKIRVANDTGNFSESPFLESIPCSYPFPNIQLPEVGTNETTKEKHNHVVLLADPLCGRHMKNQVFYKMLIHLLL